jgi:hypothetical protein
VAFAVTASLAVVSPVGEAAARSKLVAKIHGRRFKSNKHVILAFNTLGTLSIGGAVVPHRVHGLVRGFGIVCLVDDLAAVVHTTIPCGADYYEQKLGVFIRNQWDTGTLLQLTIDSFDGSRLRGTFQGTLEIVGATHPQDPPASVENGKFDVVLMPLP